MSARDAKPNDDEALPLNETPSPADASAPPEELAKLQAEKDELAQTLVRRQADFENYRKRLEREKKEEGRRGQSRVIESLLPVLDGFERALKAHDDPAYEEYRKGVELIYKQLWDTLARQGLERIDAAGKPFDPHVHLAVHRVESIDHPDGTVIEVLQEGYRLHDRVLRPSAVRVAVHPAGHDAGGHMQSTKEVN
ncbi:MAG: nucleotide exchange factor GrpE [Candidatus Acidiferrales bacterium]|jgi:molecular chaperone GrpE